jgi:hypothetical protein
VAGSPTTVADGVSDFDDHSHAALMNGNPIAGKNVTLSSSRGATDTIDQPALPTDAAGQTTGMVRSTTAGASTVTATDSTDALVLVQTVALTFVAGPVSATTSTVTASPLTVPADGVASSTITVTLLDANNNPVGGKAVTLVSSRSGSDTIAQPSSPTDGAGRATGTIWSTSAGSSTITATDATDAITLAQSVTELSLRIRRPACWRRIIPVTRRRHRSRPDALDQFDGGESADLPQPGRRGPYALIASFADHPAKLYRSGQWIGLTKGTIISTWCVRSMAPE